MYLLLSIFIMIDVYNKGCLNW